MKKIYEHALLAVEPESAVKKYLERECLDLKKYSRIWLAGFGKAGVPMARAIEEVLGESLEAGMITVKDGHGGELRKTRVFEASHPEPDQRGVDAAKKITEFLKESLKPDDLLVLVISGGGSALFPIPAEGLTLEDKQVTTSVLIRCGATIQEINAVRKHLSRVKGGKLLEFVNGAKILSLILSDVVGDDFASIASGPTAGDPTTFQECLSIIESYGIEPDLPAAVVDYLKRGSSGRPGAPEETPRPTDTRFSRVQNILVANNLLGLEAAAEKARELGFIPLILSSSVTGETKDIAGMHVSMAAEILQSGNPIKTPCCLISGGETTVELRGNGQGGRNMEFALQCARLVKEWGNKPVLFASLGSDGTDGPTDAAGAIAVTSTVQQGNSIGLDIEDYARRNDSYNFFKPLNDLIITGPTRTNVMDFRFVLVDKN